MSWHRSCTGLRGTRLCEHSFSLSISQNLVELFSDKPVVEEKRVVAVEDEVFGHV